MPIVADSLCKSYRRRAVVSGASLTVDRGEVVALLGPNGAGKTTTFYMIVGLAKPDSGRVSMDGRDITTLPMYKRARSGIGYLPQESSIFRKLTAEENILLAMEAAGMRKPERVARLEALLREFRIENVRRTQGIRLSGGEARRVEVARALAVSPCYLLLDEPFLGVDPITIADIQDMIKSLRDEKGIGILISDHNVRDTLAISDRAYIMHEGRIRVSGSSEEVAESPEAREFYLGDRFNAEGLRC